MIVRHSTVVERRALPQQGPVPRFLAAKVRVSRIQTTTRYMTTIANDHLSVPEAAIAAFEQAHDLFISVHDFSGRINRRLAVNRSAHRHPVCQVAKARDNNRACLEFDSIGLHTAAPLHPNGLIQRCHAGITELIVPVRMSDKVVAILYAGARQLDDPNFPLQRSRAQAPDLPIPDLQKWSNQTANTMLELLRQLGARLERWLQNVGIDPTAATPDRRTQILHYIANNAHLDISLAKLAKKLSLSPHRTSHAVREEFGYSYLTLVMQFRLERAASLLTHSDMAISQIALSCGFGDVSTFHRHFRKHFKVTPRQYRIIGH